VTQDYSEAARWYKLSAAQGNADAQHNLATMYFSGQGITQDYLRAYMWSNLASLVNPRFKEKRDAVASFMNQKQIAEAKKMSSECQARTFKNCD